MLRCHQGERLYAWDLFRHHPHPIHLTRRRGRGGLQQEVRHRAKAPQGNHEEVQAGIKDHESLGQNTKGCKLHK